MLNGDFSQATSLTTLYDPQPGGVGPILAIGTRPTFLSEYGCNCIPVSRQSAPAMKMLALWQPNAAAVGTPSASQIASQLANDYTATGSILYIRITNDSKITYNPTDRMDHLRTVQH